jgi:tripartite-type tricarboxylate transporter receptor subunit TctC
LDVERRAKVKFNIIHLLDTPTALTRVLGGHTDANFDNIGGFLPIRDSGRAGSWR